MPMHARDSELLQAAQKDVPRELFVRCWKAFLGTLEERTGQRCTCSHQELLATYDMVTPLFAMAWHLAGALVKSFHKMCYLPGAEHVNKACRRFSHDAEGAACSRKCCSMQLRGMVRQWI